MPKVALYSTRFLAALGFLALGLTGEIKWVVLLFIALFFLLGLGIESRPRLTSFFGKAQPFLALLAFSAALFDFFRISQSFLITVAHFLMSLQALRLLSLKKIRDHVGSAILSSLMVLSSATLASEWTFFLTLVVFLPALIWALILINLSHEHSLSEESLLGKENFLTGRTPAWLDLIPSLRSSTAIALLVTGLFCAFIFVVFPRFSFRGFRGQFLQPVHRSGFSSSINLNKSGRIFEDNSVVMRVVIKPEDKKIWNGYLRGSTLESFDGEAWRKSEAGRKAVFRKLFGPIELPFDIRLKGPRLSQQIYLESLDTAVLFAAAWPVKLAIERPYLYEGEDFSLERRPGDTWRVCYTVDSILGPNLPVNSSLKEHGFPIETFGNDGAPLVSLPGNLDGRVGSLARRIAGTESGQLGKGRKIESFLRENYSYSLEIPKAGEGSALGNFLFQSKRGNCEYFASAMCVLLRTLRIPSRVVTGFLAHEWNRRGNYYLVRMKDSHAWVEANINGVGWISFDPTPRDFTGSPDSNLLANNLSDFLDYLNLQWNKYILSYDLERQVEIIRSFNTRSQEITMKWNNWNLSWSRLFNWSKGFFRPAGERNIKGVQNLVPIGLILVASLFLWILWEFSGRKKRKPGVWFYPKLLTFLEKKGGRKPANYTIGEFARQLRQGLEGHSADVRFLIAEYYRARFGSGLGSPVEKRDIETALKRLRI